MGPVRSRVGLAPTRPQMPPGRIGGRFTAARLARLLLAWLLLLLVAAPALGAAGASDPADDTARDLLGRHRSSPTLDNCTVERVQVKAWARKKVIPVTKTAKVRVKVKPARGPLANATLVLSVSPEAAPTRMRRRRSRQAHVATASRM